MRLNALYSLVLIAVANAAPAPIPQVWDGSGHFETRLVGDGSPRQAYLYEQVIVSLPVSNPRLTT